MRENSNQDVFNKIEHNRLITILAQSTFTEDYLSLCLKYPKYTDIDGPRLNVLETFKLFEANDAPVKWNKRWRMVYFGEEDIKGWNWTAALVVQRHDILEPMIAGRLLDSWDVVGSTWLDLASGAYKLTSPEGSWIQQEVNRPRFDGNMETLERMVPDLVGFFRSFKKIIKENW